MRVTLENQRGRLKKLTIRESPENAHTYPNSGSLNHNTAYLSCVACISQLLGPVGHHPYLTA